MSDTLVTPPTTVTKLAAEALGTFLLAFGGFGLGAAIIAEVLFTAIFVLVILGVTHTKRGNGTVAGLSIGLTLVAIHLASIPIDNTSVNPARSLATALYGGIDALSQLWVF